MGVMHGGQGAHGLSHGVEGGDVACAGERGCMRVTRGGVNVNGTSIGGDARVGLDGCDVGGMHVESHASLMSGPHRQCQRPRLPHERDHPVHDG